MLIKDLVNFKDEYAMRLAQGRTGSNRARDTYFTMFQGDNEMSLAAKAAAKAAAIRAGKKSSPAKPLTSTKKSVKTSKAAKVKKQNREPRVQIKDGAGKIVTGRDNTFTCPEDKSHKITGPWSFKMHLVKVHGYSRKKAGLRESE